MARYNAANNWEAHIDEVGGIDNSQTLFTIDDATGHPTVPFKITVENEIMNVTDVTGLNLTVVRAREGTAAATHNDGTLIENLFTAEVQNDLWDEVEQHVHGNITNDGEIGTTSNLPLITGTDGILQASSFGTEANTFCQGNDSRLSDSRTPSNHNLVDTTNHPVSGLTGGHFLKASDATTYGFAAHGLVNTDVGAAATVHNLVDTTNHPVTGLTENHVLKATGATAYAFGALPAHNLVDTTNHPVSGLTAGHVLTASGATAYGFASRAGEIVQTVFAKYTAVTYPETTSASYQSTGFSIAITPKYSDSIIVVIMSFTGYAGRAAGTTDDRYQSVEIYNNTNSVAVASQIGGRRLIAGSDVTANNNIPYCLVGYYTVNSTAERTFLLRQKVITATNVRCGVYDTSDYPVVMVAMEVKQ